MISEEKIWEYLDGGLNEGDRSEVEFALKNDSAAASLYQEISTMNTLLTTQTPEEPSMSFTENVMRAVLPSIQAPAVPKISLIPLLAASIPLVIILILVLGVSWLSSGSSNSFGISDHFANIIKIAFILIDSVLLVLFLEQLYYSKKAF